MTDSNKLTPEQQERFDKWWASGKAIVAPAVSGGILICNGCQSIIEATPDDPEFEIRCSNGCRTGYPKGVPFDQFGVTQITAFRARVK